MLQVLAAFCIIAAAVCIDARQKRESKGLPSPYIANLPWIVLGAYDRINIQAANGWLLFVSIVLIIFQIAAIIGLFVDIKVLKIKIPCGGSLWYLLTIIVSPTCMAIVFNSITNKNLYFYYLQETLCKYFLRHWISWSTDSSNCLHRLLLSFFC